MTRGTVGFAIGLILGVVTLVSSAYATTFTAASCSDTDVQAAVNSLNSTGANGDTVAVPAGSCAWTSVVTLSSTKDMILQGAGTGSTTLTLNGDFLLRIPTEVTHRITGFTVAMTDSVNRSPIWVGRDHDPGVGKSVRFHNNVFTATTNWADIEWYGGTNGVMVTGLADHNTFTKWGMKTFCTAYTRAENTAQDKCWNNTTVALGQATEFVYSEDNTYDAQNDTDVRNHQDGNNAGRYVNRFNAYTAITAYDHEVHSIQGNNRAVHKWEFYLNQHTATSATATALLRGGTGVAWGNKATNGYTSGIVLDNIRSQGDPGTPGTARSNANPGSCGDIGDGNGRSSWDGNTASTPDGYPCRDQIGRGSDTSVWAYPNAFTQPLLPAYFWNNLRGATIGTANIEWTIAVTSACGSPTCYTSPGHNAADIVENRDWYQTNASFNGTSGVGSGALASRPTTCTTGVAYWATDQGSWNAGTNSFYAGQGQLYKCSSTNTWTLYYTPLTYPHPLTGSIATTIAVTSNINPSASGSSVTFTATVTPASGGPATGIVSFYSDGVFLGYGTLSSGVTTLATAALTAGSHAITATYSGDGIYQYSTSSPLTQSVKIATTISVTSNNNPSVLSQTVLFTATIAPAVGPTGTITFFSDGVQIGTATYPSSATLPISTLTVGAHAITATYAGDTSYSSSASSPLTQTVGTSPSGTGTTIKGAIGIKGGVRIQ